MVTFDYWFRYKAKVDFVMFSTGPDYTYMHVLFVPAGLGPLEMNFDPWRHHPQSLRPYSATDTDSRRGNKGPGH